MSVWTSLEPASATVEAGGSTTVTLRVRNTGDIVDEYRFVPVGDPALWAHVETPTLRLYPGSTGSVELAFAPPRSPDATAGPNPYGVQIISTEHPEAGTVVEGNLTVTPFTELRAELVPLVCRGRFRGRPKLAIDNLGNVKLTASVSGNGTGDQLTFDVHPSNLQIEPGRAAFLKTRIKPRRIAWTGPKETHPITFMVRRSGEDPVEVSGSYVQPGVLPRWMVGVLAAATAVAVALVALWLTRAPKVKSLAAENMSAAGASTPLPRFPLVAGPGAKSKGGNGGSSGSGKSPQSGDGHAVRLVGRGAALYLSADDQRHYFGRNTHGQLVHWWQDSGTGTKQQDTWTGTKIAGPPTAYADGNQVHVFARGTGGTIKHWVWSPDTVGNQPKAKTWAASGAAGDPAGFLAGHELHVFYRGSDGSLRHRWFVPNDRVHSDTWSGASIVGTPTAYVAGDQEHVFARGTDGSLKHWVWYPGIANNTPRMDTWAANGVAGDPVGFLAGNQQHVFYRGSDGSLRHLWWVPNDNRVYSDTWSGASIVGTPTAYVAGNQQHVFARSTGGTMKHWVWYPGIANNTPRMNTVAARGVGGDPAGFAAGGQEYVFYRRSDGTLATR